MYYKRLIENKIKSKLKYSGAILVAGPKYCGKTTTSKLFVNSMVSLATKKEINFVNLDIKYALDGKFPRLIDEWQMVPDIWNHVRMNVDNKSKKGMYILTGSSTSADKLDIFHSGAGRISILKMKSLTLDETKESRGLISIKDLFKKNVKIKIDKNKDFGLEDMAFYVCRGGWPNSVLLEKKYSLLSTKDYFETLFNFENSDNNNFRNKKTDILKMIVRSYARNISTEASFTTIKDDVILNNNRTMDIKTIDDYIEALNDIFIIEDIEPWSPNLRSKTAIRTTKTRHFVDTSIACMSLNVTPEKLINDLETFGLLFEDFVVKELSVYADMLGGSIKHYRDKDGLECDIVMVLDDDRYALIEVKLGGEKLINEGAESIKKLKKKLDFKKNIEPSFSAIITAKGELYKREDDIYVIPLNCLCFE